MSHPPGYLQAFCAMGRIADRMADQHRGPRRTDPVYADLRTSMDDWRIALAISIGAPLDQMDPCGGYWSRPTTPVQLELDAGLTFPPEPNYCIEAIS